MIYFVQPNQWDRGRPHARCRWRAGSCSSPRSPRCQSPGTAPSAEKMGILEAWIHGTTLSLLPLTFLDSMWTRFRPSSSKTLRALDSPTMPWKKVMQIQWRFASFRLCAREIWRQSWRRLPCCGSGKSRPASGSLSSRPPGPASPAAPSTESGRGYSSSRRGLVSHATLMENGQPLPIKTTGNRFVNKNQKFNSWRTPSKW